MAQPLWIENLEHKSKSPNNWRNIYLTSGKAKQCQTDTLPPTDVLHLWKKFQIFPLG